MKDIEHLSVIKTWMKAVRLPFSTATLVPVCLGSAAAWHDAGVFLPVRFCLAMAGALFIHFGTNLVNDYFDHVSGCDELNSNPTPFSGGSRVIQEGLLPAKHILYASLIAFALGSAIGLYLNYLSGKNVILVLGFIGVFLGFFYSSNPIQLGYGSLGELSVGIGFGPLMVLGAYYVQAGTLPFSIFLISVPVGILIALVLYINEFPDYTADLSVGKNTLVVVLGKKKAVVLYQALLIAVYLYIGSLLYLDYLPSYCAISFLSIPLAVKAFMVSKRHYNDITELLPANAATIGIHLLIGLLLSAGLILDSLILKR